jgi:hypothetical protein
MTQLSHDSVVSKLSSVSDTAESMKINFVYDLAPWLSGVTDTAESKLNSVIDTAETAKTPLGQF